MSQFAASSLFVLSCSQLVLGAGLPFALYKVSDLSREGKIVLSGVLVATAASTFAGSQFILRRLAKGVHASGDTLTVFHYSPMGRPITSQVLARRAHLVADPSAAPIGVIGVDRHPARPMATFVVGKGAIDSAAMKLLRDNTERRNAAFLARQQHRKKAETADKDE
jgi:hypothetical protein